jgi:hypothetical protein
MLDIFEKQKIKPVVQSWARSRKERKEELVSKIK